MKHASEVPLRSNELESAVQRPARTASILLPALLLALSGCGIDSVTTGPAPGVLVSGLTGVVHGGQNPITSSAIRLMVPATNGYAGTPSVLATTTTDSVTGAFVLPTYTCPTPDQLVYLEASGGNSGAGTNTAIDEVALLGNCSTLSSSTHVVISEVTTIAAAYALAPFASVSAGGTGIGTSSTNLTGLNNAFGPANNLVSYNTGNAYASTALPNMVLPTQLLNTLANILSSCVNSTALTPTACSTLFTDTTVGGVAPLNTFQAALNIALHPGANIAGTTGLYSLASSTPPFQPAMTSATAPNDFTLAIGYNGYTISAEGAYALAIDANGNAWVTANAPNTGGLGALMEITPSGQFSAGSGYQTSNYGVVSFTGLAIDPAGVIWVASNSDSLQPVTTDAMIGFTPNGSVFKQFPVTFPLGVAVDGHGDVWSSNWTTMYSTFQELQDQSGTYTNNAVTVTTTESDGGAMCIGPMSRDVWEVAEGYNQGSAVTLYDASAQTQSTITPDAGGAYITGCAVDHTGNIWLADGTGFNGVEVYNNTGALLHSYAIAGQNAATGQFNLLQDIALDGLGNAFVSIFVYDQAGNGAATYPGRLVELSSSGAVLSPAFGYQPTSGAPNTGGSGLQPLTSNLLPSPGGIAVDGSGNVWLTGLDYYATGAPSFVTEVLGIAAPVVTPKATAITNNTIAMRP